MSAKVNERGRPLLSSSLSDNGPKDARHRKKQENLCEDSDSAAPSHHPRSTGRTVPSGHVWGREDGALAPQLPAERHRISPGQTAGTELERLNSW